ncbi:MFS transporter [Anoxybacillus rupiensis]|uniref:MFS transporter n=1 Tax=Anoxybacteroides rupiense TaxID=311460 RepID=UPI001BA6592B|nr:MFS transporter [Anoxybacillus rupiensis]MBS2771819.1 MFS transporter [Anoxybacillus rupiensis]
MWRNRNVWIILSGEFIAGLGLWVGIIGNLEFLQRHVSSDFFKSLILFIGLLAGVLVSPMAGKVCDRFPKKTVLLYSGLLRMISVIFMMLALHFSSIGWMIMFTIVIQIAAAFYFPALQSTIPLVVEERQLLSMNGVHMNVSTISRILGTALGGLLLAVVSLYFLYIASFIAYGLLLVATCFLQVSEEKSLTGRQQGKKANFSEMIPILKQYPLVKISLLLTIIPTLFLGGFNLTVINISELQHDSTIKGLLYTVEGISFMVGTFVLKRIAAKYDMQKMLYAFSLLIAFAHVSLYFADIKITSLLSFALFGFSVGCFFPTVATIFQKTIPKEYHGRFFSLKNMLDRIMFQIVLLGTGFLLDMIGLKNMMVVFGAVSFILVIYFFAKESRQSVTVQGHDSSL